LRINRFNKFSGNISVNWFSVSFRYDLGERLSGEEGDGGERV